MKRFFALATIGLLAVTFLPAQQPQSQGPPDVTTALTNAGLTLAAYQQWLEGQITGLWAANAQVQSTATQNTTDITALTARVTALEKQLAATTTVAPIHIEAESAIGVPSVQIQSTGDLGGGAKVALLQGMKLSYSVNIPVAGNYTFSARLCTDANAVGSLSGHFEFPVGTNVSGALGATTNGNWVTFTSLTPVALPSGPVALVWVTDSVPTSMAGYFNYFEVSKK